MITRKTTTFAFLGFLIIAWLMGPLTQVEAETTDEQERALIGEWRGMWPGFHGDTSTLVIHDIDTTKAKAQCTYTTYRKDSATTEHPVLADFFAGPNPKLEFKIPERGEFQFVLKDKVLEGTFRGMVRGWNMTNIIKMEKYTKQ